MALQKIEDFSGFSEKYIRTQVLCSDFFDSESTGKSNSIAGQQEVLEESSTRALYREEKYAKILSKVKLQVCLSNNLQPK